MPRHKARSQDRRARDHFYWLEVTNFETSGRASTWHPDELPDIYEENYRATPDRYVLHEDLDIYLALRPVEPVIPKVVDYSAELHGSEWSPRLDFPFHGGMIQKRKDRASFWFHSSLNLTRDLASTLLAGKRVFVCFQGAKLYYGKALLCGIEWWTGNHPDLLAEVEDLRAMSNPS